MRVIPCGLRAQLLYEKGVTKAWSEPGLRWQKDIGSAIKDEKTGEEEEEEEEDDDMELDVRRAVHLDRVA